MFKTFHSLQLYGFVHILTESDSENTESMQTLINETTRII